MGIYGGFKPEDWSRWGQFTTYKSNVAELLRRELRPGQSIYCSPLVDPYQPAEAEEQMMPQILDVLLEAPPRVFTFQTRGPLILRDLDRSAGLSDCGRRCASVFRSPRIERIFGGFMNRIARRFEERLDVVRTLREAGIETYATLAPLLPCDPEVLAKAAIEATRRDLIGDPLHIRATKQNGATTREAAFKISSTHHHGDYFDAAHQATVVEQIDAFARAAGFTFTTGPRGFARLAL